MMSQKMRFLDPLSPSVTKYLNNSFFFLYGTVTHDPQKVGRH